MSEGYANDSRAVPEVDDLPEAVRLLAVALCTATRIEPELMRAMRVGVRPDLLVSAETALWFGPWSLRSSARYMALRKELLRPLRDLLRMELAHSPDGALIHEVGGVIMRVHEHLSPALALEEQVTWAAVRADAGFRADEADADIDRLLERALRTAVQNPARRERLQRWFAGAWQRFPDRVRETPAALELFGILGDDRARFGTGSAGQRRGAHLDGVDDAIVAVRHDGSHLTIGDPRWPAEGILVPDTQPRVLEVADGIEAWDRALRVRVPRGGRTQLLVSHVPVFVRTSRGVVYEVGARAGSDLLSYPAQTDADFTHPGLLGTRVAELRDIDALRFGIAARLVARRGDLGVGTEPDRWVRTDLVPRMARPSDVLLPLFLNETSDANRLVVVTGDRSSGRTRAAWEAVRQALGEWWVWSPPMIGRCRTLLDAIAGDRLGSHTVLWLDDLDRILRSGMGEEIARALLKVLDDRALTPVLLMATGEVRPTMEAGLGPVARVLLARASFVQAASGRQGTAPPPVDTISLACRRVIAQAASTGPGHKIDADGDMPARPTEFVGQAVAVQRLFALWAETAIGRGRVTVLTGMPGVGKTALAVEAVYRARERGWFPGGVLWISLPERPLTAMAVLQALGVSPVEVPAHDDEAWLLCSALLHQVTGAGSQPALLVADGISSADTAPLSRLAPGLSVLLTTRLPGSEEADRIVVEPLGPAEAVTLLSGTNHSGGETDAGALADLAERCGRLPLALTVAAGLLRTRPGLTAAGLVDQMRRALVQTDVLAVGDNSVRSALDWTYRQLRRSERDAFMFLGLMPGDEFSSKAVSVVTGLPAERLLVRFRELNLMGSSGQVDGRWQMHPLIKQYAADLCRQHLADEERTRALTRLMSYYEQYAREADAWTRAGRRNKRTLFSSRQKAIGWLEAERRNLVACVDVCLRHGLVRTGEAIALSLAEFLTQTRHFDDLLHVMNAVLNSPVIDESDHYTRTAVLNNFAVAMATTGDFEAAMAALKDAERLGGEEADRSSAYALMLGNLGATLLVGRRLGDAVQVLKEAADHFRRSGDRAGLVQVLSNLGMALLDLGEVANALVFLHQAHDLSRHTDVSVHDQAVLLSTLGTAQLRGGQIEEGLGNLSLAAYEAGKMGEGGSQGAVLESLGRAMLEIRHFEEAIDLFYRAVTLYTDLGDAQGQARADNNLGLALLEGGQEIQALLRLERARETYLTTGDSVSAAQCLNNVGNALRRQGRHDEAVHALNEAVGELRGLGDERALAEALLNLGLSFVELGDTEGAHAALTESAEKHKSLGDITSRARALHALGRTARGDDHPTAVAHLRAATEAFRQGGDTPSLFDALLLLSDRLNAAGQLGEARAVFEEALRLEPSVDRPPSPETPGVRWKSGSEDRR
ncbi:tetratricopeptide repeat protein [Streptomyces sp. bgisy082]|uniref:tetratricopeptide repeat protein n=1 Tax=Streptomyces sp. bgisy082 TaxID=3413776 RepID=UPI003D72DA71